MRYSLPNISEVNLSLLPAARTVTVSYLHFSTFSLLHPPYISHIQCISELYQKKSQSLIFCNPGGWGLGVSVWGAGWCNLKYCDICSHPSLSPTCIREAFHKEKSQNCGLFPYSTEAILVDEISTKVRIYPPKVPVFLPNVASRRYALLEKDPHNRV